MFEREIITCRSCEGAGHIGWIDEHGEQRFSRCKECKGTGQLWIKPESGSGIGGELLEVATERSGCLLAVDLVRWVFRRPDPPESVKNLYVVGLLLLGPLVGYLASVGPVMIVSLLFGGLKILSDPYFQSAFLLGLYGAALGGASTVGSFCLEKISGRGRQSLFQGLVVAVKIALVGGLFLGVGMFFAILNPN